MLANQDWCLKEVLCEIDFVVRVYLMKCPVSALDSVPPRPPPRSPPSIPPPPPPPPRLLPGLRLFGRGFPGAGVRRRHELVAHISGQADPPPRQHHHACVLAPQHQRVHVRPQPGCGGTAAACDPSRLASDCTRNEAFARCKQSGSFSYVAKKTHQCDTTTLFVTLTRQCYTLTTPAQGNTPTLP